MRYALTTLYFITSHGFVAMRATVVNSHFSRCRSRRAFREPTRPQTQNHCCRHHTTTEVPLCVRTVIIIIIVVSTVTP